MARLLLTLALLAPNAALACAPCELGDPTPTVLGTGAPYAGRLRVGLAARYGLSHEAGEAHDARLTAVLAYSPLDRLTLTAAMPLAVRAVARDDLSRTLTLGPGDATLDGRVVLLRDRPFATRHRLSARLGLSLPTSIDQVGPQGERRLDAQTGSGAFTPLAGLVYAYAEDPWAAIVEYALAWPIGSRYGATAGPTTWLSVAGQGRVVDALALRLEARLRADAPDQDGANEHRALSVAPSILLTPAAGWLVQLEVRVPVWQGGVQRESLSVLVALVVDP